MLMLRNRSEKADKKVDLLRYSTSRGRERGLSCSSLHLLKRSTAVPRYETQPQGLVPEDFRKGNIFRINASALMRT
jgi:hypothetical protein